MNPIISVIVVTYNQEATIARTLDSILAQRCHAPFEIVIGEDGSSDGTRLVCQRYVRQHPDMIRLMPQKPNKGVVNNYMDCLLATRGTYIADCAGDDYWIDSEKLEKELRVMEQDDQITLVHTGWNWYDVRTGHTHPNTFIPFPDAVTDGKKMLEAILTATQAPVVHLCTALYRAAAIRQIYKEKTHLFRGAELVCEDLQITFTLAATGKFAYLPDLTLNYSYGKESISNQGEGRAAEGKQFVFMRRATDLAFRLMTEYDLPRTATLKDFFALRVYSLQMHAFRLHDNHLFLETQSCIYDWQVVPTMRIKLLQTIMSHPLLWSIMLHIRNVVVCLKHFVTPRISIR